MPSLSASIAAIGDRISTVADRVDDLTTEQADHSESLDAIIEKLGTAAAKARTSRVRNATATKLLERVVAALELPPQVEVGEPDTSS